MQKVQKTYTQEFKRGAVRLAQTSGKLVEAAGLLQEALDTFAAIHSQFKLARTHLDLASLASSEDPPDVRGVEGPHAGAR